MAELEIRQMGANIYNNMGDGEVLPLFIRYSNKDTDFHKEAIVSFEDIIAQLSGIHTCYFIHRKQKSKTKVYDELAIKFDDLPFCMTAKAMRDGFTLSSPRFTTKNMVLPEESEQYKMRKCDIRFVDFSEDSFKLINSAGPYWLGHVNDITDFIATCFALPIPPIEIQIEEDKEMWQAYLDGLNELLENKRDLIKIRKVTRQKHGLIKLDFDMDSYAQNLINAISDELKGKCETEAVITIEDGECIIAFDNYQIIPDETIEHIKTIGQNYCFLAANEPTNIVTGKIAIISDPTELAGISASIDSELTAFGVELGKTESGEFLLTADSDMAYLKKIVDTKYKGIAEVVCTTKLIMPLSPAIGCYDISKVSDDLPAEAQIKPFGKHYVVSSKRPLDVSSQIFSKLKFASCQVSVSPQQLDTNIEITGATIKGNSYSWIINNPNELSGLSRLFNEVRKKYPNQFISSTYSYAFAPQIDRTKLAELKLQNYGKASIHVDVPRSCIIFNPKSEEDFVTLREDILSQLDETICADIPDYKPTAKIDFLCENEEFRRGIIEKVNVALADKRRNFTTNKLSKDAKELLFAFEFSDIEERDNIEKVIAQSLTEIHGVKVLYEDDNNKGVTQWILSEDVANIQKVDLKLQSEFKGESVNYINGRGYDNLNNVDEEELAQNR